MVDWVRFLKVRKKGSSVLRIWLEQWCFDLGEGAELFLCFLVGDLLGILFLSFTFY